MKDLRRFERLGCRWNGASALMLMGVLTWAGHGQVVLSAVPASQPAETIATKSFSSTTQPATAPQAQVVDLTPYAKMVEALGNEDFEVRNGAQKRLDLMGWEQKEIIEKLADKATDIEAKARLSARVEAIEDQYAADPPPISIDVKDATLGQVAAALANATGTPISGNGGFFGPRFTLKATNESFIAILKELNALHPLEVYESSGNMSITLANTNQEMTFTANSATLPMQFMKLAGGRQNAQCWLIYSLMMDPRIRIADVTETKFLQAIDNNGGPIAFTPMNNDRASGDRIRQQIANAAMPPNMGTKLILARGESMVTVIVHADRFELDHPQNNINKVITLGKGATIKLTEFELTDKRFHFQLQRSPTEAEAATATAAGQVGSKAELFINAALVDASGRIVDMDNDEETVEGDMGMKPPYKIVLRVPTRTKTIKVPFEVKNVPLR